jgi:hypothetical protein
MPAFYAQIASLHYTVSSAREVSAFGLTANR